MTNSKKLKTLAISRELHKRLRKANEKTGLKFYEFIRRILEEAIKQEGKGDE